MNVCFKHQFASQEDTYPNTERKKESCLEVQCHLPLIIADSKPVVMVPLLIAREQTGHSFSPLKVVRKSDSDKVTVVGAGVTLVEAVKAAETLAKEGINIRVVDPFTLKPIDKDLLLSCAKATGGRIVVVEDHYAEGGRK